MRFLRSGGYERFLAIITRSSAGREVRDIVG